MWMDFHKGVCQAMHGVTKMLCPAVYRRYQVFRLTSSKMEANPGSASKPMSCASVRAKVHTI